MHKSRENIKLKLSFKQEDEQVLSKVQKEIIKEDLERFTDIKENDINISTSYVFDTGDTLEASIFFRNGLNTHINFDIVPLKLIDGNENVIATQVFKLSDVGDIPPFSVRPYKIYFNKEHIKTGNSITQDWKVIFDTNIKAVNTVKVEYEDMPEDLSEDERRFFQNYLSSLPILEKGQVDLKCYDIRIKENNMIKVTILIRNGADKAVKLKELPITIYDKDKNVIYSSVFAFEDLNVNGLKAKLCNFIVDCSKINLSEFNLENLSAEFKN
ncbi:SLAP domain-containing protein [Clostridium sp. K25]|uniref:SLAP domain-containing protein n=1 Tax=Clostridium sp. K25 TaxID=1443109 RepID=UPI0006527C0B|nr:SLAP domain-containing protein [Clostridium sp. K25]